MHARLPIGFSDFATIRRQSLLYVDKSALAAEVVRSPRQVVLLPRPRRFGKTLNLTMLRAFFERGDDAAELFEGLAVTRAGPDVLEHMGRHPVIFLTFKDVKQRDWETCLDKIAGLISAEVVRLRPALASLEMAPEERELLLTLAGRHPPLACLEGALALLSRLLHAATGEPVVILIDEYDTPIHAGFAQGYYDEVVSFTRNLLSAGFKDNPHLYRGVITGILRVAREALFSGLNNVAVHTVLSDAFADHFGFLEEEVVALAEGCGVASLMPALQDWYNGYQVGSRRVYNPWSITNALANPADGLRPYWVNTASDEILRDLLVQSGLSVHEEIAALIRGETILRPISEDITLREVHEAPEALWSFLLFSGYLTATAPAARGTEGIPDTPLRVPNREVATVYRGLFSRWMERGLASWSDAPRQLAHALLHGDAETFESLLERLMVRALSFHDVAVRQPEAVYQAFIVGLLVQLEATHEVRSNRESGHGRYDLLVRPRAAGSPGAILELKVIQARRGETSEQALERAMAQVRDRDYAAELFAAGAAPVWCWAAVFDGKRVSTLVEQATPRDGRGPGSTPGN